MLAAARPCRLRPLSGAKSMFYVSPIVKRLAQRWGRSGAWGVAVAIALTSGLGSRSAQAEVTAPAGPSASPTVSGGRIIRPTLQLGSQGESVRELQSMLMLLGYYPGPVTGIYSEDTAAAARRFQSAATIAADGIVGPATWSRLFPTPPREANPPAASGSAAPSNPPATAPAATTPAATTPAATTPPATTPAATAPPTTALPVLRFGMEGDAVRQLQQRLRTKGFYNGAIDGIFGSQTEAAVRQLQTVNNLIVDGIVGPATWRVLN
ncbi:MAG: peptidoglycan-binding protein [Leptolyngbya sp. DLM2.Bin27]|nr:MAG: peptidoglycan-binding protein [Leptolyngbya sp. DLM2.Bin27]